MAGDPHQLALPLGIRLGTPLVLRGHVAVALPHGAPFRTAERGIVVGWTNPESRYNTMLQIRPAGSYEVNTASADGWSFE